MPDNAYKLISAEHDAVPSLTTLADISVTAVTELSDDLAAIGFGVPVSGEVPSALGLDRETLGAAGFEAKVGQTLVVPQKSGATFIAVGVGDVAGVAGSLTAANMRDIGAAFARAAHRFGRVGLDVVSATTLGSEDSGKLLTEGVLLARYRFNELKPSSKHVPLNALEILVPADEVEQASAGVETGRVTTRATCLARDLANTPPGYLTATNFGEIAEKLGPEHGLTVDVFDKEQIIAERLGGLLAVNAGSVEEPRMIQLRYTPEGASGHLALVGKGIMYDSGGISLKPSDPMHLLMKMDMAGAAAAFAAMTVLKELGCTTRVTAILMCTDNMPSGSAAKLGDVFTARNGMTVEIQNTDAEGRLVMSDALVLAAEEKPDAIVDIATLTGAALAALGTHTAPVLGNNQALVEQLKTSSTATDESIWQLPLESRYRKLLDSNVADISNLGGKFAGATTAALFLNEFVDSVPWAHLDIAGTMQVDSDDLWRSQGATGFGARLLTDLALNFEPPAPAKS